MPRRTAYETLKRVDEDGAYSHLALNVQLERRNLNPQDRGLATRITYGVLTWRQALDALLDDAVDGGIRRLDDPVLRVLRIGLFQIAWLDRIPDHAAVDTTVSLTEAIRWEKATGLVNAVMRRLADWDEYVWWREADREDNPVQYIAQRYSLASWLSNRLRQIYGDARAIEIAEAWTKPPPVYVRLTGAGESTDDGRDEEALEVVDVDEVPGCARVERGAYGLRAASAEGQLSVQDKGSQLVGWFVGAQAGDRVVDACAGLGGKTRQLAEAVGEQGRVVAVDRHGGKLERLAESLETRPTLDPQVDIRHSTLTAFAEEHRQQGGDPFDHVLVDAPCSALGTLRRHPEIRWRRREADIPSLVEAQRALLASAAELVAPGGVLTYAVCTFLNEETGKQIRGFIQANDDFQMEAPPGETAVEWATFCEGDELKTDPVSHDADMFYAARLRRDSH